MQMVQVELERPTGAESRQVMVAWIPQELRTKQGDVLTAGNDPVPWRVARQYSVPIEVKAIHHTWKAGGVMPAYR